MTLDEVLQLFRYGFYAGMGLCTLVWLLGQGTGILIKTIKRG